MLAFSRRSAFCRRRHDSAMPPPPSANTEHRCVVLLQKPPATSSHRHDLHTWVRRVSLERERGGGPGTNCTKWEQLHHRSRLSRSD